MILIIETIERTEIRIGVFHKDLTWFHFETVSQSSDLLPKIRETLEKNKIKLTDLTGILVSRGPGSFTGIRIGVTTANTLAWSLNIPVLGYRDGEIDSAIRDINCQDKSFSQSVIPFYPNN